MKKLYEEDDIQDIADAIREVKGTSVQYKVREMANALLKTSQYQLSEVYGNTKQSELPDGYTQLEYIESTGTQYIELNYGFMKTDEIDFKFSEVYTNQTNDKYMVAPSTWNNNVNRFAMGRHLSELKNYAFTAGYGSTSTGSTYLKPHTKYTDELPHIWHYKDYTFSIDDPEISLDCSSITFGGATTNLRLFYGYNSPTKGAIYYWKHKKIVNGELVLVEDLVPAKRNSDNVIGMFDKVTNKFFENIGTGSFVAGSVITPSEDNPIEIKSVGDKHNNKFIGIIGSHKFRNYNTGILTTNSAYEGTEYIKVKPSTKYTLSGKILDTSITATKYWIAFTFYDEDFNYLNYGSTYLSSTPYARSTTTPANAKYMSICFWASNIDFTYFQNTMLNEGSTALTYEPYKAGDYGIELYIDTPSENLYDKTQALTKQCYIGSDGLPVRNANWHATDFIKVSGKQFTLSRTKSTGNAPCIAGYDKDLNLLVAQSYNGYATIKISSDKNIEYIRFSLINTSEKEEGTNIMLNAGLTAKEYQPYKKPISVIIDEPLHKVGDVTDILTPSGLVRKLRQTDYTGTKTIEESIEVLDEPITETVKWSETPISTEEFTPTFLTEIQPSDYTVEEAVDTNFLAGYDQAVLDLLSEE